MIKSCVRFEPFLTSRWICHAYFNDFHMKFAQDIINNDTSTQKNAEIIGAISIAIAHALPMQK